MIHCMQIKTGYKYNYTVLRGRTDNTSIVPVKGGRAGVPGHPHRLRARRRAANTAFLSLSQKDSKAWYISIKSMKKVNA